jgi:hypothetical protein
MRARLMKLSLHATVLVNMDTTLNQVGAGGRFSQDPEILKSHTTQRVSVIVHQ